MLTLYYSPATASMVVHWLLIELDVEHELVKLDFDKLEHKSPEYLKLNPNGKVPTLVDGDVVVWESNTILRYLGNKHGGSFYPADPATRSHVERWMDWQQTTLNRASGPAFVQWVRTPVERRDHTAIAASTRATEPLFDWLDQHLAKRAFMLGDAPGMADFPIVCELHRWFGLPQTRPAWPHLHRYFEHWLAQPCAKGVLDLPLA